MGVIALRVPLFRLDTGSYETLSPSILIINNKLTYPMNLPNAIIQPVSETRFTTLILY